MHVGVDVVVFLVEESSDRLRESGVGDPVAGPGRRGREAAAQLVFALGARFESAQSFTDAVIDALVVAGLEVEAVVVGQTPPVTAVQRVVAAKTDGRGNGPPAEARKHDHHALRHGARDLGEEFAIEVGRPAAAQKRVRVVLVNRVPVLVAGLIAPEVLECDIGFGDAPSLAAHLLPLHRCKPVEEVLKGGVTVVMPVELAALAGHEPLTAEKPLFHVRRKQNMKRRGANFRANGPRRDQELRRDGLEIRVPVHEQALARGRREGYRGNELRVVGKARPLVGGRPTPVEYELPAGVVLDVEGQGARQAAGVVRRGQVGRAPGRFLSHASGDFQRAQELVAQERRVRRQHVPRSRIHIQDAVMLPDSQGHFLFVVDSCGAGSLLAVYSLAAPPRGNPRRRRPDMRRRALLVSDKT